MEADESGTFQGSSYLYMAAQDWARLADLYARDGVAPDGTRLLPEDWVDYVTAPTAGSNGAYGVGFWLVDPAEAGGAKVFYMSGFQGQRAYVAPEYGLVVVRLGATLDQSEARVEALLLGVARAMRGGPDV